ncbi:proliferation marker protein Ki-67 isoform X2 [Myxocyprinus asiaticus]|nr:proliferation marker protein Ki-67 isoform X2 [Myxocyprinus asiaticus]
MDQTVETAEDGKFKKDSMSPFCELYQMVKQDLAAKSPWKPGLTKTPIARPQVDHEEHVRDEQEVPTADVKSTPKRVTTPSTKKRRSSFLEEKPAEDMPSIGSSTPEKSLTPVSQKKRTPSKTPQKFSAGEVVQQILIEEKTPKSPKGSRSNGSQDQSIVLQISSCQPQTPGPEGKNIDVKMSPRTSPRANAGKRFQVQDVLHEIKTTTPVSKDKDNTSVNEQCDANKSLSDVTALNVKRKRVSFGGQLSPELFDKRLPPNSPLRRGSTPGRRSLGLSQKPQSLLRRASTIGLLALRFEAVAKAQNSASKKASPKRAASAVKTPSPAKRSPNTKAKTPSPKRQKSPSGATRVPSSSSSPATPASARRASNSMIKVLGDGSVTETPRAQGRFSISRVSTPSPVQDQEEKSEVEPTIVDSVPQESVTPKIPLRRKSMKSSARKTPKSAIKSKLDVMRSRRSGASLANLKVLTSWADIVKFGQTKPQTEVTAKKKIMKGRMVKRTIVSKLKTPARRLKDDVSTGHAASPATIVVGKAHMRTNQPIGAAPKIVPNMALFKKDMKMDEDFTGVADIFKTPANSKSKNVVSMKNACPETPVDEMSIMKTPEESGEMMVSPLSVVSAAKCGRYNNEAVTRLLNNQDGSLMEDTNDAYAHEIIPAKEIPTVDQMEEEKATPETPVRAPKKEAAPSLCLTGVRKLMKTPKQRAEPIEDLRGKLLKTPKEMKPAQEESLEGVKELLKTPKHRGAPVEDMVGVKRVMQTPKEKSNPVLCAAGLQRLLKTPKEKSEQCEDLTGVKELMQTPKLERELVEDTSRVKRLKTPKQKREQVEKEQTGVQQLMKMPKQMREQVEEDQTGVQQLLKTPKQKRGQVEEDQTGVQQLMKTPKCKGEPIEDQLGVKRLMKTPKKKAEPVEDLTGVKQLMQTPKQKGEPVNNQFGISELMKTPQLRGVVAVKDFTGFKELEDPESSFTLITQSGVTEPTEIQEPMEAVERDSALPAEDVEECDKENVCPVETMETEVVKSLESQCTAEAVDSKHDREIVIHPDQNEKKPVSIEVIDVCSSEVDGETKEQSEETVCASENNRVTDATSSSSTAEEEGVSKSLPANKIQRSSRGRAAHKPKNVNNSEVDKEELVQAHVSRPGRRKKTNNEIESQLSQEHEQKITENVCEETAIAPEGGVVLETSISTEAPVTATRARKGRPTKKGNVNTESTHTLGSDMTTTHAAVVAEKALTSVANSGQGRMARKGTVKDQALDDEPMVVAQTVAETNVDSKEHEAPLAKSRRGRKATEETIKDQTLDDHPKIVLETVTEVNINNKKEPEPPVAKSGRGRFARKGTVQGLALDDDPKVVGQTVAETNFDSKEPEAPLAKSGRGRKATKETIKAQALDDHPKVVLETATEANINNKEEPEPPVAKSGRGRMVRKGTVKDLALNDNPNVVGQTVAETNFDSKEEHEAPIARRGRMTRKGAVKDQALDDHKVVPQTVAETSVDHKKENEVPVARRGRMARKGAVKDLAEDDSKIVNQTEAETSVDSKEEHEVPVGRQGRVARKGTVKDQSLEDDNKVVTQTVAQTSVDSKEEHKATVARRGRMARKGTVKDQSLDDDHKVVAQTEVEDNVDIKEPQETVAKSKRGRTTRKETFKDQALDEHTKVVLQTVVEDCVDSKMPEAPHVKFGRGRKAKQQKPQTAEEVVLQPDVDTSTHVAVIEEHPETVVKSVRGIRQTKQSKAKISVEAEENVVSMVEQVEVSVVKSVRKRGVIAKGSEMEKEVPVKRGRRAILDPAPPVAVVSSRGLKAVKAEPEVTADPASTEEPVKPIKHSRQAAKVPESKEKNTKTEVSSEHVTAENTAVALKKVERGIRGKKCSTKDTSNTPINESATADKADTMKPTKTVNCNPDLVTSKDTDEFEPSEDVKEPQLKKSKKFCKLPAETTSKETNRSIDQASKGRKGRGTKKDEPSVEDTQEKAKVIVKPLRSGKAATAAISEPNDSKASTLLKRKRNEVLEATDDSDKKPLPKRRGRVANSSEVAREVSISSKEMKGKASKTSSQDEAEKSEATPKKNGKRTSGLRKTAQELDPAPAQTQESLSGRTTRKGRSLKKAEADISTKAAPVRCTRRK